MIQSKNLRPLVLGAALLASGLAVGAQAQPAPQKPAAEGRMAHRDPAEMAAKRADRLRTVLQLKPSQENALQAFLSAMKPPEGAREKMRGQRGEMAKLTTPERLDRMKAMMARREAEFDKRASATKRFYAQLDPAQQKAFDAMGPMMGHGGRHGPEGMRGEHRRPGFGGQRGDG